MARQGLNSTLSYTVGSQQNSYKLRTSGLQHGMKVIYTESSARVRRTFYPHRLSQSQFVLQVQLVGEAEYRSLSGWLADYADHALNLPRGSPKDFPYMAVSVPSRNFIRYGVPMSGFEWGDRVGAMLWTIQITFETYREPGDALVGQTSFFTKAAQGTNESQFFYPSGQQLSGSNAPPDGTYATPIDAGNINPGDPAPPIKPVRPIQTGPITGPGPIGAGPIGSIQ